MPEIWENPFANAILKIERADKHISDIEQRFLSSDDAYYLSLGVHADAGEQFLYYRLAEKYIRATLALMIGDAIHNLRCALDIAWVEILRLHSAKPPGRQSKFPIYPLGDRHNLESALAKVAEIPSTCPVVPFLVDAVKPYKGGDTDLLALHDLDVQDKHELLIPILNVLSIDGVELEHEDGKIDCLTLALTGPIPGRVEVPFGSKLKNHGHATFQVKFGNGTPAEDLEVVPTLRRFSAKVTKIVRRLQRIR